MRAIAVAVALVAVNTFAAVDVPGPKVVNFMPDRVLAACDGQSSKGCTQFRDAALLCECREAPDGWRVYASARAIPTVYVEKLSWVAHEMTHIADFRHFLKAHLGAIESRRFADLRGCERYTRAAMEAFGETLQRIARISADRRDGKAMATSEDHFVVVKAEVMPKLVDDRLANLANDVAAVSRNAENRTAENRDLIGKRGQHVEAAVRQRNAAVDPKKLVAGSTVVEHLQVLVRGLFFDDDHDVVEEPRKFVRKLFESLFDELVELRSA